MSKKLNRKNPRYTPETASAMRRARVDSMYPGLYDVIVYYPNRKFYSRLMSAYVTHANIMDLMLKGKKFEIRDKTFEGENITERVSAEAWFEHYKEDPAFQKHVMKWKTK